MFWFHKKKADTTAALPTLPKFTGALQEQQQASQTTPQYTQQLQQAPLKPVEMPRIQMPVVEIPPATDVLPGEIPKREPIFLQKKTYPQRDQNAMGFAQQMSQMRDAKSFEEVDEHGLPKRTPQGLAFKQQGFAEMNEQQTRPRTTIPATAEVVQLPQDQRQMQEQRSVIPAEERPVFVKLEEYREVINNIEILKQKVKETEYFIEKIEELRGQEQSELQNCHANINKLKEKLIAIDKKLFEV